MKRNNHLRRIAWRLKNLFRFSLLGPYVEYVETETWPERRETLKEFEAKITVRISDEDIYNILRTAVKDSAIDWRSPEWDKAGDPTDSVMFGGICKFVENGGHVYLNADGRLDVEEISPKTASAIIQYALFGEIVCGERRI